MMAKHTGILMSLQHELRVTRVGVPELHATILATGHDPLAVWRESD